MSNMKRSDLIEHQKLNKDVWTVPSDGETEKSRHLKAIDRENKLLLIAIGAIIALFGFFALTYGVYW